MTIREKTHAALGPVDRLLDTVGDWITKRVGTMWCALLFLFIAIAATPHAFPASVTSVAQWIAQDVLQLVLLSIIMVGQSIQSRESEQLTRETHDAVLAELADLRALLAAQGVAEPEEGS